MKYFFRCLLSYLFFSSPKKIFFMVLPVMILLSGCYKFFYNANTTTAINSTGIQQLQSREKYFILHFDNKVLGLTNVKVENDSIKGLLEKLPAAHGWYLTPNPKGSSSVKKVDKENTLQEVHLYTKDKAQAESSIYSAPLPSFYRMDVYALDAGRTKANHIMSTVGVGIVGALTVFTIAFAIACNCPQVYTSENGDAFQFVSGVYSGAVYSTLERTDYLPLQPGAAGVYGVQLRNDAQERQYINAVQLMEVSHPDNARILMDKKGKALSYTNCLAPAKAYTSLNNNVGQQVSENDNQYYSFDNVQPDDTVSSLFLHFKKPKNAVKAKLILRAKNSMWAGYVYEEFSKLFGKDYEAWRKQKEQSDPKLLEEWEKEQSLPLMVYTGRANKWQYQDYFPMTGNTASRTMILELDVKDDVSEELIIKLETIFRFWDVDFAAIDYSENASCITRAVPVVSMVKDGVDNIGAMVEKIDKEYSVLNSGEKLDIEFRVSGTTSTSSYFLLSTGYYHRLKQYEGAAKLSELVKFKKPHSFNTYSYKKYLELTQAEKRK